MTINPRKIINEICVNKVDYANQYVWHYTQMKSALKYMLKKGTLKLNTITAQISLSFFELTPKIRLCSLVEVRAIGGQDRSLDDLIISSTA